MRDDEVLAAGLADDPGIGPISGNAVADLLPDTVEHTGAAREMDAREVAVADELRGNRRGIARHEIDDARGKARCLEDLHDVVRRQHGGARGLPYDGVAHERGRR